MLKIFGFVRGILLPLCIGIFAGYLLKERLFTDKCPDCICPQCPPQNVTNLIINNEKVKAKGGGTIDLNNILKDNNITQEQNKIDSVGTKKQKGLLKRIFTR